MIKYIPHNSEVTKIVINYKQIKEISKQLLKICPKNAPRIDEKILVIDNSAQVSKMEPSALKEVKKRVRYIASESNLGYGSAVNRGSTYANTKWLLFLNPDVTISEKTVKQWMNELNTKNIDAACPTTTDPRYTHPLPTVWWFLAEYTPLKRIPLFALLALRSAPQTLWGGCLLIKRSVFEALGGFDERFFLWFEDSDLTRRLLNGGYQVAHTPGLDILHAGGSSFVHLNDQEKRQIFFASAFIYARKHCSLMTQAVVKLLQMRYVS